MPESSTNPGGGDAQDQLSQLMAELKRLEGQQEKLRKAVAGNTPIVVHPRKVVEEEEEEEPQGPPKPKYVASGGLAGFYVAQDLLMLDFSEPKEAPEEFRAMTYSAPNSKQGKLPKPGEPGSFGTIDPTSREMQMYLAQLQEQQRQMLALIAAKHRHRHEVREAQARGLAPPPMPEINAAMLLPPAAPLPAAIPPGDAAAAESMPPKTAPAKKKAPAVFNESRAPPAFPEQITPEMQAAIAQKILAKEEAADAEDAARSGAAASSAGQEAGSAGAGERVSKIKAKADGGEEEEGEGKIKAGQGKGGEDWAKQPVVVPMQFGKGGDPSGADKKGKKKGKKTAADGAQQKKQGGLWACFRPGASPTVA